MGACPFDLSSFDCADTPRSSFIRRVCYDADERFMAIDLNETWYLYCAVDPATVHGLLTAQSARRFYNAHIRRDQASGRGAFDCSQR
ncbi:MAG: KTSC domain-containing protein [Parvularculaceae bacterium]